MPYSYSFVSISESFTELDMNVCSGCGRDFTSASAFDSHQRMTRDNEGVICNVDRKHTKGHAHAGKPVLQPAGTRNGRELYRFADYGQFAWAKPDATVPDTERPCQGCGTSMRKKPGRGRWPSKCTGCGGTGRVGGEV